MSPTTHMILGIITLMALVMNILTILLTLRELKTPKASIILAIANTILAIYFFKQAMPVLTTLQL